MSMSARWLARAALSLGCFACASGPTGGGPRSGDDSDAGGGPAGSGGARSPGGSGGNVGGGGGSSAGGSGAAGSGAGGSGGSGGNADAAGGAAGTRADAGTADRGALDVARVDVRLGDAYIADRPPNAAGILVNVRNGCGFDLWIHAAGQGAVLQPDNARLAPGESRDYLAPDRWTAARVTAYLGGPNASGQLQNEIEKVEMTLVNKVINYNITYVDWLGLPVEMIGFGSGADCKRVGCYIKQGDIATSCPDGLLQGQRCLSAGSYCANAANRPKPFCHALDAKIAQCAGDAVKYPGCGGAAGTTTPQVYGCSGFFGGSPKWCAALNRGMLDDPDNGTITLYYKNEPYNTYSKWVHTVCPGIYAFPYDDYGKTNESGFHACSGGTQLNITFCPGG